MSDSKGYTIFGMKPIAFAIITAVMVAATFLGVLPTGMVGAIILIIGSLMMSTLAGML